MSGWFTRYARQNGLPPSWAEDVSRHILPWLELHLPPASGPARVLGLHGCQGSGKTTLARALKCWAEEDAGLATVHISLDDYYLGQAERRQLADALHPLLVTRGVPGTHAICHLLRDLTALKTGRHGLELPRFLKAMDDRAPREQWRRIDRPVQWIILEGWCLGLPPQSTARLQSPVNALEAREDAGCHWRQYVNDQLAGPYRKLWSMVDHWLMLAAPGFHCVETWRWQQEEALRRQTRAGEGLQLMNREALREFLQHYQRWTEHALKTLPRHVHHCVWLDERRRMTRHSTGDGRVAEGKDARV